MTDPVRAALADEWDRYIAPGGGKRDYITPDLIDRTIKALRAHLPGRLDCGGALKSLSNEISGWLSAYEPDLRAAMGNTNFAVMEHKLAEANVALLKTDVEYHRGYAAGVADQIETQEYDRNSVAADELIQRHASAYVARGGAISDGIIAECGASREALLAALALSRAVDGGAAGEREAAIHDALLGLIEAVELDSDTGGKGISGYTAARLTDARAALLAVKGNTP